MPEEKDALKKIAKLGTAKIAGLVCNKRSPMVLRIDLELPADNVVSAIEELGLEPTDEILKSLEVALQGLKQSKR